MKDEMIEEKGLIKKNWPENRRINRLWSHKSREKFRIINSIKFNTNQGQVCPLN